MDDRFALVPEDALDDSTPPAPTGGRVRGQYRPRSPHRYRPKSVKCLSARVHLRSEYQSEQDPMNVYDIIEMLKLGEGWSVDFKRMLPKPGSLALPLVAFANHQGGTILIG